VPAETPAGIVDSLEKLACMGATSRLEMAMKGRKYIENTLTMDKLGIKMEQMLLDTIAVYSKNESG